MKPTRLAATLPHVLPALSADFSPRSTRRASLMGPSTGIEVRLAANAAELDAAQRLRYDIFYGEWGVSADAATRESRRDHDRFDALMDHLVVIDHSHPTGQAHVVGTYRLLRRDQLSPSDGFYSSGEFNLSPLLETDLRLLELGRSCVAREYRNRHVLKLLWAAITAYVAEHRIDLMFGCASLRGTDPDTLSEVLSFLHHQHLAEPALRPRALAANRVDMNRMPARRVDPRRAMAALEPIIKGYLRAGASVGEGASIDHKFNCIDVCIVLPARQLSRRYLRHLGRSTPRVGRHPMAETASLQSVADRPVKA